jgi:L-lactate dehydrogenase complex protein LldG
VSARDEILGAVRAAQPAAVPRPEAPSRPRFEGDLAGRFEEMLAEAGGSTRRASRAALPAAVAELASGVGARTVLSLVPEVLASEVPPSLAGDPRGLAGVDFALFRADFGVAENGAVWVTDRGVADRAVYFLPEHVAVLLDAHALVPDMHAAYARLRGALPGFGCFVAGPSKTADIEQALVIGAHGPRSLAVLLVEG